MPAHFFLFVHVPKRLDSESFPYRWTPPIGLLEGKDWPDGYDRALTAIYLAVIFGLPILGYVFMVLDFRRYLRSLRRALVLVAQAVPVTPYWALRSRPNCLKALGLMLPCSEEDVLAAYRELAKTQHPDRGGDLDQFLQLQRYFEQARRLVLTEAELARRARPS